MGPILRSISKTKLVVNEQLKPVTFIHAARHNRLLVDDSTHARHVYVRRCRLRAHALPRTDPYANFWRGAVRQAGSRTGQHHVRVCRAAGCLVTRHGSSADFYVILCSQPRTNSLTCRWTHGDAAARHWRENLSSVCAWCATVALRWLDE